MPIFKYKALTPSGEKIEGNYTASTKEEVLTMIRQKKYYLVSVSELVENKNEDILAIFNKVKIKDIAVFCRQFYTMLNAGVTIINCLDILRVQTESKKLRSVLTVVFEDVQKGYSLSESMRKKDDVFPELLINMVAAGEISGNLDTIMNRMSVHYEKENKIMSKVRGALVYPAALAVISIVIVVFLLTFVMPTFVSMFESSGVELPTATKILLGASKGIKQYGWLVLIVLISSVYYIRILFKTSPGRRFIDRLKLRIPIIKGTTQKLITSRFTRTLATLMSSGIPLIQALEVVSKVVGNKIAEDGLMNAIEDVKKGFSLSQPIRSMGVFPPMVYYMINIGEESGSLDEILERTASFYDDEVETSIQKLVTLLEPLMIVVMAVVVGSIAISMVLPMFNMMQTVKL